MIGLEKTIKTLATPLSEALEEFNQTAHLSRPDEAGFANRSRETGAHAREDNVLELGSKNVGLFLDGTNGRLASSSAEILFKSIRTWFITSVFSINGFDLNNKWIGPASPSNSPVTFNEEQDNVLLVTGQPQPGQSVTKLSDLLKSEPLFVKDTYKSDLETITDELQKIMEELNAS